MHRILAEFVPALMPGRLANHGQVLTSAVTGKVESTRRPAWQMSGYAMRRNTSGSASNVLVRWTRAAAMLVGLGRVELPA